MNSISLTNEELAVLPRASVCEAPNQFSNGSHTYIILVLAQKKIKIQNNADLTRNSAPMLASFLVKSALFCIFIFFCAKTSIIYVCGGI